MTKEAGLIMPRLKVSLARAFKALALAEGPDIIFLLENKVSSPRIDKIKHSLGFANFYCVDSEGKAKGLALFWKLGVEMKVVFTNKNVMASLVYSNPPDNPWLLIVVHGPPYLIKRKNFGELMENIISGFVGVSGILFLTWGKFIWGLVVPNIHGQTEEWIGQISEKDLTEGCVMLIGKASSLKLEFDISRPLILSTIQYCWILTWN